MQNDTQNARSLEFKRYIKAYPKNHACIFKHGELDSTATLIAMNHNSARIRCMSGERAEAIPFGARLGLRPGVNGPQGVPGEVPCRVAWKFGAELGLEFDSPLVVGVGELQRAFER